MSLSSKSVFNQAASNLLHSVSSDAQSEYFPSSLLEASNCCPYHLVIKTNKKYCWDHVHLSVRQFKLSDILDDDGADMFDDVNETKEDFVNFQELRTFKAKGKVAASLAMEIAGLKLHANRHVAVSVDFGQIVKKSLDIRQLAKSVAGRKINLKENLIQGVMANKLKTLCLVVTTLNTEAKSKITSEVITSGDAKASVPPEEPENLGDEARPILQKGLSYEGRLEHVKVQQSLQIDGSIGVIVHSKRTLEIPANTPLAYRMMEILFRSDGTFELKTEQDDKGGFEVLKDDNTPKARRLLQGRSFAWMETKTIREDQRGGHVPDVDEIRRQLKPILSLPDQDLNDVRHSLIELLKIENSILLNSLNIMFQEALNALLVGQGGKPTTQEILREKLGCSDLNDIKPFLQVVGFSFEEDSVMFPTTDESGILICTSNLLDPLGSLTEDQGSKLYECSEEEKRSITKVLAETLAVERLPLDQSTVSNLFTGSSRAESLLISLGFQLERTDGNRFLSYSPTEMAEDDLSPAGLLVIMCALWDQN